MTTSYQDLLQDLASGTNKKDSVTKQTYHWITPFIQSLDGRLRDSLGKREIEDPPPYNGYAVEEQLGLLSKLLDRCLLYRRDYENLEVLAVRQALDYRLFTQQLATQKELEIAVWQKTQRDAESLGLESAVREFSQGTNPIEKGFAATSQSSKNVADAAIKGETTRKSLLETKWTLIEEYQRNLEMRHTSPPSTFHFVSILTHQTVNSVRVCEEAHRNGNQPDQGRFSYRR